MAFRLKNEVEEWFRYIADKPPFKTKFDLYYLCLMLGIATGRMDTLANAQEFVDSFVADYRPMQRIIIALFLISELHRMGLEITEREEVHGLLNRYIDSASPANLTEEGFAHMNQYASGGYLYLVEKLQDKPHQVEDFLQFYTKFFQEAVSQNPSWTRFIS